MSFLTELLTLRRCRELSEPWIAVGCIVYSSGVQVCTTQTASIARLIVGIHNISGEMINRLIDALRKLQDRDLITTISRNKARVVPKDR